MVVFTQPSSCAPCRRLKPHLDALKTMIDMPIVIVDMEKNPGLGDILDVSAVPTVMLYRKSKPVRIISARTSLAIKQELAAG